MDFIFKPKNINGRKLPLNHLCYHQMVNGEQTELLLNLAYYIRHKFANEKIIGVIPGTFPFSDFLQKSTLARGVGLLSWYFILSYLNIQLKNVYISYLYIHNCLYYILCFCYIVYFLYIAYFVYLYIILFIICVLSCCCLSFALWSFYHHNKFQVQYLTKVSHFSNFFLIISQGTILCK